jgi:AraC-like DNA-binding protein
MYSSPPSAALKPFASQLWVSRSAAVPGGAREHVLPTGQMHLVFRLDGPALRIFKHGGDEHGDVIREPVVGGLRTSYYAKEVGAPVLAVGVQLLPGAAQALFGVSAAELAGRHTALSELWGAQQAASAFDQLASAAGPAQQAAILEALLAARLPRVHGMHPAVAQVLAGSRHDWRVDQLVRDSSYSHRGFIALFRQATGCSPKRYARLLRFQALLMALRATPAKPLGELALDAGYSDQAHMNREFREFAGVTPQQYRQLAPAAANHLRIA